MTNQQQKSIIVQREEILCVVFPAPVKELRLIAPVLFENFFRFGQLSGVYDQVTQTLDHFFIKNSMNFACTGDSSISWSNPATVALDLEFMFLGIFVFFRLSFGYEKVAIELHHISFESSSGDPDENTVQLAKAIHEAMLFR